MRKAAGFTLVELLTVIAIMVMLAAITVGILNMAQKKAAKSKTEGQLQLLITGLERYEKFYNEYPEPIDNTGQGSGGAETLYQALSGDGSDSFVTAGEGSASIGELGSSGEVFLPELDPKNPKFGMVNTSYQVVDPYGQRWRYRKYIKEEDGEPTHNRTYDLWSVGEDTRADNEARWIKNW